MIESFPQCLYKAPYQFQFVQIVRLLGTFKPHSSLIFKSRVFVSAPPGDVQRIQGGEHDGSAITVHVNFMGIAGIQGPLPMPYTELLMHRSRKRDYAFQDFLDIFNQRLLTCFYNVERKYHPALQFEEPDKTIYGNCLKALGGWAGISEFADLSPRHTLLYTILCWQKPRNPSALQALLSGFFSVRASVTPFDGAWIALPRSQRTYLGYTSQLGRSTTLGTRAWCRNYGMIVRLEVVDFNTYLDFLPCYPGRSSAKFIFLKNLLALYVGPYWGIKVQLVLKERPLGVLAGKLFLGWSSWLGHKAASKEPIPATILDLAPFQS